jgi:LuxR family maltose regulon positive regulatory protein
LVTLVGHIRGTTQITWAGRGMPVPLARQRAQGGAVEVGPADLTFTEDGARELLRAAGADLPEEEVVALARRTEGWAAGLYLAALARTSARNSPSIAVVAVDDRLVADYLESELLSGLPPRDLDFLTRTVVLERLSGALCDAVLGERGSTAELERLQRNNLFLVPLDGQGRWFRYHPLFTDLLRARLDLDHARQLQRRAAEWHEADGQLETALHYARDAEDVDRVARIAGILAQALYARRGDRRPSMPGWSGWTKGARSSATRRSPRWAPTRMHSPEDLPPPTAGPTSPNAWPAGFRLATMPSDSRCG